MEFAKADLVYVKRSPEQREHRRRGNNAALGSLGALGGSFGLAGVNARQRTAARSHLASAGRATSEMEGLKHVASATKKLKGAKKTAIASNLALGGSALLAGKSIYHSAKSTPQVVHKASRAERKKLKAKSDWQEAGAIGAVSGGGMGAYYGAKELGAAGRARASGFKHAAEGAEAEAKANPKQYGTHYTARPDTPPKAPYVSSSKEVEVHKPTRTYQAFTHEKRAQGVREAGAKYAKAGEHFAAGKRLRSKGMLLGGAGLAGIGGAVELERRSIQNRKKATVSKADRKRHQAADIGTSGLAGAGAAVAGGGFAAQKHANTLADAADAGIRQPRNNMIARAEFTAAKGAHQAHAARAGKAGKVGAGVAAVGLGGLGLSKISQRKKKGMVSKADRQRAYWEFTKALSPIEGYKQIPEKKKREGYIAGGGIGAVVGGTTAVAAHDSARRAGHEAVKAETQGTAYAREAAKHSGYVKHGGGPAPDADWKLAHANAGRTAGSKKNYHANKAAQAAEGAKSNLSWAAHQRGAAKRAKLTGKIGIGVGAAGVGTAAYGYHRKQRRKREFGKALVSKDEKERKGPRNPLVTGGLTTAGVGGAVFAGSRVPYHMERARSKKAETASTDAWRQSKNFRSFGDAAMKEAKKPSGTKTGWDAKKLYQEGHAAYDKAKKLSTESTSAKGNAIKIARVGRKGLIGVAGGLTAAGVGGAYTHHRKRTAQV
jgi:hypothetical protein